MPITYGNKKERISSEEILALQVKTADIAANAVTTAKVGCKVVYATVANLKAVRGSASFTGSTTIDVGVSLSSADAVVVSLVTAPAVAGGDPYLVTAKRAAATNTTKVTLEVWQDNAAAATKTATVNYIVVG